MTTRILRQQNARRKGHPTKKSPVVCTLPGCWKPEGHTEQQHRAWLAAVYAERARRKLAAVERGDDDDVEEDEEKRIAECDDDTADERGFVDDRPPEPGEPGYLEPDDEPDEPGVWTTKPSAPGRAKNKNLGLRITITSALADVIDRTEWALGSDEAVFTRDYKLVHVTHVTAVEAQASPEILPGRRSLVAGTPRIHEMEIPTLRERLTRVALFERMHKGKKISCVPTEPLVTGLHCRKEWPHLRPIIGIAETPFLRPDGTVCQEPGYDAQTGYIYAPTCHFPAVPDKPTPKQAAAAYRQLAEVYEDFPFTPSTHSSVPIAGVLTIVGRPAIAGSVPITLLNANTPGSGKSLVTDTVATIVSGRAMPRMNYTSREEEQEKMLGGYALQGAAFFSLDNIASPFGGAPLDKAVTSIDTVQFRILSTNKVPTLPWRALPFGTGNNIELCGDMAPRVLFACLESPLEDPRTRTDFAHDNLLDWIRANRPRLVVAALTILRAYVVAGRPDMGCARWGSFEPWSRLVPHAIVFAGGPDPLAARIANAASVNTETRHRNVIVEQWPKLIAAINAHELAEWQREVKRIAKLLITNRPTPPVKPKPRSALTCKQAIYALYDPGGAVAPDHDFDALRASLEELCCPRQRGGYVQPTTSALSAKLRGFRKQVVGGKRLRGEQDRTDTCVWWVEDAHQPAAGDAGDAGGDPQPSRDQSLESRSNGHARHSQPEGPVTTPARPASPALTKGPRS